ncbi:MAG: amino acid permease [Nanoarchaeota archaeon]|nr:amino acid permease [Nanoarchaeota archaeon]
MDSKLLIAIALMVSTVAGASILGFPYVFAQVGFLTGLTTIILVGIATTLMTLYIAELSLNEKKEHMISGLAKKYFGKRGKIFTLIIETFGIYTAMIAYLIAIGLALADLFGGSPVIMGSVYFVFAAALILFGFKRFNKLDLAVAALKIIILIFLIVVFIPTTQSTNTSLMDTSKIFVPFGIILFSCLGYNVIPEMKRVLGKKKRKVLTAISLAMAIVLAIYILFSYTFVGNFGSNVKEVAVVGLPIYRVLGDIFVLIAMGVPFIALSDAIKHVYVNDMGLDKRVSWFLSAFIPFLIYVYVKLGFVAFLQISGTYAGGLLGLLTMIMVLKARKRKGYKKLVPGGSIPIYYSILIFAVGILYQTLMLIK